MSLQRLSLLKVLALFLGLILLVVASHWAITASRSTNSVPKPTAHGSHAKVSLTGNYRLSVDGLNGQSEDVQAQISAQILASPTCSDHMSVTYSCLVDRLEVTNAQEQRLFSFVRDPLMTHSYHTNPAYSSVQRQWWYDLFSVQLSTSSLYEDDSLLENLFWVTLNERGEVSEVKWPLPWRRFWGKLLRFHPFEMAIRQKLEGPITVTQEGPNWKTEWHMEASQSLLLHQASTHCHLSTSAQVQSLYDQRRIREETNRPVTVRQTRNSTSPSI